MVPYGGLATVMMNLYRNINKKQFDIDFASTNSELDESLIQELNRSGSSYYSLGSRKKNILKYSKRLSKVIKRGNYDIIHINSNSATALIELEVAKKYCIKKRIVHNHTSICDHKILHMVCYPFFRKSYTDAIACSRKAGEWIFRDGNFQVLNNGIDSERYRFSKKYRTQIRMQYGITEKTTVLGHVGKIYKPKNHLFLIDIFNDFHTLNQDSKLLLVGDGDMRHEIEKKVERLGLHNDVIFAGMQRKPEQFLSAMDVFVFPSIWEGMPLSVIEAQASGLLCLVSDRIDEGIAISKSLKRISIEKGSEPWIEDLTDIDISNRESNSDLSIKMIIDAGYDAKRNSIELEDIYNSGDNIEHLS